MKTINNHVYEQLSDANIPQYTDFNRFVRMLERNGGKDFFKGKPHRPFLSRAHFITDDLERTYTYLVSELKNTALDTIGIENVEIDPRHFSEIYAQSELSPPLFSEIQKYENAFLLIRGDFKTGGRSNSNRLMLDLVENEPDKTLQDAWKEKRIYTIFVSNEEEYTFYLQDDSKNHRGLVRPPTEVYHVLWEYKNPEEWVNKNIPLSHLE